MSTTRSVFRSRQAAAANRNQSGPNQREEALQVVGRHMGDLGDVLASLLGCPHAPRLATDKVDKAYGA
jgi:hypothetical protein